MRATMTLPGKTEAGSAGMQPCRGIAWWAHRDDVHGRGSSPFALFPKHIGLKDPHALKIPARRAEYLPTESALSPFHAEPAQLEMAASMPSGKISCSSWILNSKSQTLRTLPSTSSCVSG